MALESYLKSVGKTAEILRAEYEMQAKDAISLELILNAIADDEKIGVPRRKLMILSKPQDQNLSK